MKLLRKAEIARRLDVSRWTVYRIAETDPTFPREREISPGVRGRLEHEFDEWLRSRPVVDPKEPKGDKAAASAEPR